MGKRISIEQFLNEGKPGLPPNTTDFYLFVKAIGVLPEEMKIVGAMKMENVRNNPLARLSYSEHANEIARFGKKLDANRNAFLNLDELRIAKEGGLGDIGRIIRNQKDFSKATLFTPQKKRKKIF